MRPVRVVVADGGSFSRAQILGFVERGGFDVVGEALERDEATSLARSRAADLILVSGNADFAAEVRSAADSIPIVAVVPDAIAAKEFVGCGAAAIVPVDCDGDLLAATARVAMAAARELAEAKKETFRLRDQLETRKLVERAKGVLMQRLGITEDVAYRRMQRASQEENRKMRDIAESILSAERLYSDKPPEPL